MLYEDLWFKRLKDILCCSLYKMVSVKNRVYEYHYDGYSGHKAPVLQFTAPFLVCH